MEATVFRGINKIDYWEVASCPFCGRRHIHGYTPSDEADHPRAGYRVAHCGTRLSDGWCGQYRIVRKGGRP